MSKTPQYQITTFNDDGSESFEQFPTNDFSRAVQSLVERIGFDADYKIGRDSKGNATLVVSIEGKIKATVAVYFPALKLAA